MPVDARRVKELFGAALDIPDTNAREAYLDRECGEDAELRQRLDALLKAHEAPASAVKQPLAGEGTVAFAASEKPGNIVAGRYKLLESIGEGGMGTVWVAEQTEPVRRKVAIKLIKAGMDSRSVLARFEAERQALAMMDHPNIAKVLDGGLTEQGRPYFVMEYVKGVPITEYCDATRLSIQERLQLFIQVCQAVQHAHQKGIIHRDLKPSNILVAPYDDKPVPKIIDFGLAKAMHQSLTERTLHTAHESVLGTPLYMSPEQAQLNNLDVDTRSDIYSLGVLLYELLTGTTPLEKQRFRQAAWDEVRRIIREEEPPRPSTRLSSIDTLPTLAAGRHTDPLKLTKEVKGELDWIVMKALEKDRTRRYETANGFAADVQRYLTGEPVQAHPPNTMYRIKKFVRRYRGQVLAASVLFLALVVGTTGTTLGLLEARRQEAAAKKQEGIARDEAAAKERAWAAEAEQRRAAERTEKQTQKRLAQIEKGIELFAGLLADLDPNHEEKGEPPLFDQLRIRAEKAADELQAEAVGDHLAVARLQTILGKSLYELGSPVKAISLLEQALRTRTNLLGSDHIATQQTKTALAMVCTHHSRVDDAIRFYEEILDRDRRIVNVSERDRTATRSNLALAYREAGRHHEAMQLLEQVRNEFAVHRGPDHDDTLTAMRNLSDIYSRMGRSKEAVDLAKRVWLVRCDRNGVDHPLTLSARQALGVAYWYSGELTEAIREFEYVRQAHTARLGADHPAALTTAGHLAVAYMSSGRAADAIRLYEQVRDAKVRKHGDRHPEVLDTLSHLGLAYTASGQIDVGIRLLEQTRDAQAATLGENHPNTLNTASNLAARYPTAGRLAEALQLAEKVRGNALAALGPDHPITLNASVVLGSVYLNHRRYDDAIRVFEAVRSPMETRRGPTHFDTLKVLQNLAFAYKNSGRPTEALPIYEKSARGVESYGFRVQDAVTIISNLCGLYEQLGKPEAAEVWWRKWLAATRPRADLDPTEFATGLALFGKHFLLRLKFAEAEELLRECQIIREKTQPDDWKTFNTRSLLGGALLGQKRYAEAEPLLLKGYEGMKSNMRRIPKDSSNRIPEALDRLIQFYTETNKPDEVKKWQGEKDKLSKSSSDKKTP